MRVTAARALRAFAHKVLGLAPQETIVRVLSGPLRGAHWLMRSGTYGCWTGTYERDTQRVFAEHVRPGDVVFDLGANVGFFTLLAARLVGPEGQVLAFEPLPQNLDYLDKHIQLNAASNVTVFPLAISSKTGLARFSVSASRSMGGLSETGEIEVRTTSLDVLLLDRAIPRPTFLKIDVEGEESSVLAGAAELLATARPTLLLSTHGYRQHELCWSFLEKGGYAPELLRDGAADGNYVILARGSCAAAVLCDPRGGN